MSEDQVLDESKEFNVVDLPSVDKVPVKSSLRWLFCCMTQEKDELADSYHGPGENLRCQVHESADEVQQKGSPFEVVGQEPMNDNAISRDV